ncbi:H-NS histone family protein [Achromobacter sp. B7]|uniref:H-NS histone family protein n=1 Tax=Achromobacter sp. B7 TaxID=2282475 RepID=UPI000E76F831|nr:H-NS histone family protein [Achromobacter sp. B7]AYD66111.1 H-NS histone family protein [Achromobacter sp. B7]
MQSTKALAKLTAQIEALERRARTLRANARASAVRKIVAQMHEFQISPSDVKAAFGAMKPIRAKQKKALERPVPRRVVPEKYRHPETGETWTGRGRAPRWLAAAERAGASREQFRV